MVILLGLKAECLFDVLNRWSNGRKVIRGFLSRITCVDILTFSRVLTVLTYSSSCCTVDLVISSMIPVFMTKVWTKSDIFAQTIQHTTRRPIWDFFFLTKTNPSFNFDQTSRLLYDFGLWLREFFQSRMRYVHHNTQFLDSC